MNGPELLRVIDTIHRDKDIDKETLFEGIESALLTAARKKLGAEEEISIRIDRESGELSVFDHNQEIVPIDLGRIAAQTAKQVIIQKIREAENDVIYNEFESRERSIITGTVQRFEGPNIIVNLGRVEGRVPKHEQVRGEVYHPGDRIRGYVYEVKMVGTKVIVRLSRTHPDFIQRLFELEVPEIADGIIQIVRLVREPGYRTKIAVSSNDPKIDCVGACVGVRGTRIKNIIDELGGEKIDIIRWSDDEETLIVNALKPAQISSITLDHENNSALVIVDEDQLSLAIGKRGQNVRLASKLCQWDINIVSYKELEELEQARALEESGGAEDAPEGGDAEAADTESADTESADTESADTEPEDAESASTESDDGEVKEADDSSATGSATVDETEAEAAEPSASQNGEPSSTVRQENATQEGNATIPEHDETAVPAGIEDSDEESPEPPTGESASSDPAVASEEETTKRPEV